MADSRYFEGYADSRKKLNANMGVSKKQMADAESQSKQGTPRFTQEAYQPSNGFLSKGSSRPLAYSEGKAEKRGNVTTYRRDM